MRRTSGRPGAAASLTIARARSSHRRPARRRLKPAHAGADAERVAAAADLALVRGLARTRSTLERWNAAPWPVLRGWLVASAAIAAALLLAVWVIGSAAAAAEPAGPPVAADPPTLGAVGVILRRNGLVLALHAFACVAGFIAGSSLPEQAERHGGLSRRVHDRAGPLAILFVAGATAFSLLTQAFTLGAVAATLAAQGRISVGSLLLGGLPHAVPELMALFLPLAAWLTASRRGDWHELLAATLVTVALAAPVLGIAAVVEVYVSPHLLAALSA